MAKCGESGQYRLKIIFEFFIYYGAGQNFLNHVLTDKSEYVCIIFCFIN